jgi:hypothetical protein
MSRPPELVLTFVTTIQEGLADIDGPVIQCVLNPRFMSRTECFDVVSK